MIRKSIRTIGIMVLSVTLMLGTTVFAKEADISTKKKTLQEEIDQYVSEQYYQLSTSEHEKLARDIYGKI